MRELGIEDAGLEYPLKPYRIEVTYEVGAESAEEAIDQFMDWLNDSDTEINAVNLDEEGA